MFIFGTIIAVIMALVLLSIITSKHTDPGPKLFGILVYGATIVYTASSAMMLR